MHVNEQQRLTIALLLVCSASLVHGRPVTKIPAADTALEYDAVDVPIQHDDENYAMVDVPLNYDVDEGYDTDGVEEFPYDYETTDEAAVDEGNDNEVTETYDNFARSPEAITEDSELYYTTDDEFAHSSSAADITVRVKAVSPLPMSGLNGKIYFGFSGNQMSNAAYINKLGRVPALKNEFFPINRHGFDQPDVVDAFISTTLTEVPNAMMMLTLEPFGGLDSLTDTTYQSIANKCTEWTKQGIKVYLRFAHEMNANWYPWGKKPDEYKQAFRDLAMAIRAAARDANVVSLTRMVWAPAVGYSDLTVSYLDFYPGDDVVDWVGLSLYHFATVDPKPDLYVEKLTTGGGQNFYAIFCVQHNKPMLIAETSAPTAIGMPAGKELTHKQAWWRQLYSPDTAKRFPMLRMVVWFEFTKNNMYYGVFTTSSVGRAFVSDIGTDESTSRSDFQHLLFAGDAPGKK